MSILSGYKKVKDRILTSSGYQLLSRWTSSNTVDFDDGKTAQTKVGAINGIVKDKNSLSTVTDDSFAASAVAVKDAIADVNSNLENAFVNNNPRIKMAYYTWSGHVVGGQSVNFGTIDHIIPVGCSLVGLFLTPRCTVHISISYYNFSIFAYSESYTGDIYYDALILYKVN